MPSLALRFATFAGVVAVFSLVSSFVLGGFNVVLGGVLPFIISYFLMGMPSRNLVDEVVLTIDGTIGSADAAETESVRRWRLVLGGFALVVLVTVVVLLVPSGSQVQTEESVQSEMPVGVSNPIRPSLTTEESSSPAREYSIVVGIGGRLDFLHPDLVPGSTIARNAVVARIDVRDLQASLDRVKAELDPLAVELEKIDDQLQWLSDLGLVENLSEQQRAELQAERLGLSNRRVDVATETSALTRRLKSLEWQIKQTEITSPANLRVDEVPVKAGEYVAATQVLFTATEIQ